MLSTPPLAPDPRIPEAIPLAAPAPPRRQERRDFLRDAGRPALYVAALVLLGALAIPMFWVNRRIGVPEKILLTLLGILQTLGAIVAAVLFGVWVYRRVQTELQRGGARGGFGMSVERLLETR